MAISCFGFCRNSISTVLVDTHEHPLQFVRNSRTPYKCDGCKEIGFGSSYKCGESNCPGYQLHEECSTLASARSPTPHPLFSKNVNFIFHKQSPKHVGSCVACGKDVQGFMWEGSPPNRNAFLRLGRHLLPSKPLVMHPRCFNLPSNRTNQGLNASEEGLNLELKEKAPSKCLICERKKILKKISGWAYVSTGGEYCYHVKCVKDLVDKNFEQQSDGTNTSNLRLEVMQKAFKVSKEMIRMVLTLILSAIFGDAVSDIVNLVL